MPLPGVQPSVIQGDMVVEGNFFAGTMNVPAGAVDNASVASGTPGNFIDPSKLESRIGRFYAQPNTTATTETRAIHYTVGATGSLIAFQAGSIAKAVGAATVTVDLKKNGASVLSALVTLDSTSTSRAAISATIATAGFVVGDEFEIVITATAGGGTLPTGVFVNLLLNEDPF